MGKFIASQVRLPYLQGPHIELSILDLGLPASGSYARLVQWVESLGYRTKHPILFKRRYPLSCEISPGDDVFVVDSVGACKTNEAMAEKMDYVPIRQQLTSYESLLPVEITYSELDKGSINPSSDHVVEVLLSGEALDLKLNRRIASLSAETILAATEAESWINVRFRELCARLAPTMASCRWERSLLRPYELLSSADPADFTNLYLSKKLLGDRMFELAGCQFDAIAVNVWENGVFISERLGFEMSKREFGTLSGKVIEALEQA